MGEDLAQIQTYQDVLDRNPDMPRQLRDHVERLADQQPSFEEQAVTDAESIPHDWGAIDKAAPVSSQHAAEHRTLGMVLDSDYDSRTSSEQRALGIVGELGEGATEQDVQSPDKLFNLLGTPTMEAIVAQRSSEAVKNSEFVATPEVEGAIEGYYKDHYDLAGSVKKLLEGTWTNEELAALSQSKPNADTPYRLYEAKQRLVQTALAERSAETPAERQAARLAGLDSAANIIGGVLFNEVSVGQQTIGQTEIQLAEELYTELRKTAVTEGFMEQDRFNPNVYHPRQFVIEYDAGYGVTQVRRELNVSSFSAEHVAAGARRQFQEQIRRADQKLYHASPYLDDIALSGKLATRQHQARENGYFRAGSDGWENSDGTYHSNALHFSQSYLSEYGQRIATSRQGFSGKAAESADVSNGTIVLTLGDIITQTPYEAWNEAKLGLVQPKDSSLLERSKKDAFANGHPGAGGGHETDDIFYADWSDKAKALDYAYPLKGGFILQTAYDRARDTKVYGIGENFPGYLVLDSATTAIGADHNLTEQAKDTVRRIHEITKPAYENQLVVPLRSGCLAFDLEFPYQNAKHTLRGGLLPEAKIAA